MLSIGISFVIDYDLKVDVTVSIRKFTGVVCSVLRRTVDVENVYVAITILTKNNANTVSWYCLFACGLRLY